MKLYAFADEASPMIDAQIAAMKRNGLDGLEIRNVDQVNVADITLEKAKEVKEKLDAAGLVCWSIGSPLGKVELHTDFDKYLEKCRHTYEVAKILGTDRIRMFSFHLPKDANPDDYEAEVVEKLGRMIALAEEYGLTLCHENEKGIFGDTAVRCRKLLDALPQLACIFDPANFLQVGQDTLEGFELLKDRLIYMHIKDCMEDGSVVPAGKGIGHLPEILKQCKQLGVEGLTLEPHLTIFAGLEALEQEGNTSKVGGYAYPDADTAFDAACDALKEILP